ncbi:ankyrin repeat-containing domain protein [Trichinella spiralis]|nr:ankyrin repeat-containing domain protein [Trichinella spiralis]
MKPVHFNSSMSSIIKSNDGGNSYGHHLFALRLIIVMFGERFL